MAKDTTKDTSDVVEFSMGVSKGGLQGAYTIPVTLSFAGVARKDVLTMAIAGLRVRLQNMLRTRGDAACKELAKRGLSLHVSALSVDVTDAELLERIRAAYAELDTEPPADLEERVADPVKRASLVQRFFGKS